MSQFFVSGPAYTWVGTGINQAFEFLGFTESGLTVSISGQFEDVQVDYAGAMPGDVSMLGQEARISGVYTRYNETVLNKINSFIGPISGIGIQPPGAGLNNSVGVLLQTEGGGYPVLCWSPYSFKSAYSTMIPGFLFHVAYIVDAIEVVLSVRRKAPSLSWRAIPTFGTFISGTFHANTQPYNAYELFSTTMPSPIPSID